MKDWINPQVFENEKISIQPQKFHIGGFIGVYLFCLAVFLFSQNRFWPGNFLRNLLKNSRY